MTRVMVVGGEKNVRRAVAAAAKEAGVEARIARTGDELADVRPGDSIVDLALPPRAWSPRSLVEDERTRARELLRAAAGCRRVVRVSVVGAKARGAGALRSAAAGVEEELRAGDVSAVALRVGVVLGDCGLVAVLRRWIERSRLLLVPGIDRARLEPLGLRDLARYCVVAATAESVPDDAYDLSCGEMLTGGLLVSGLADNLGLRRWCVPSPFVAGSLTAVLGADEARPRAAVGLWLDALSDGVLPRGTRAWKHFDVEPTPLREAMAEAVGMIMPLRRRGEGRFENWRAPDRKGILWTRRSTGRRRKR